LIGKPGTGKSSFVRRLCDELVPNPNIREFNITHFKSVDEITAQFDVISSLQHDDPKKKVVVFWDEINARINGEEIYSYFLGPIAEGTYRRDRNVFHLGPCIWIFAGTTDIPESKGHARNDRIEVRGSMWPDGVKLDVTGVGPNDTGHDKVKGSDFASRIHLRITDFAPDFANPKSDLEKLERMYLATSLACQEHSEVDRISKVALQFFKEHKPRYNLRSLGSLMRMLHDVSYGELTMRNVPPGELLTEIIDHENLVEEVERFRDRDKSDKKEDLIRVRAKPDDWGSGSEEPQDSAKLATLTFEFSKNPSVKLAALGGKSTCREAVAALLRSCTGDLSGESDWRLRIRFDSCASSRLPEEDFGIVIEASRSLSSERSQRPTSDIEALLKVPHFLNELKVREGVRRILGATVMEETPELRMLRLIKERMTSGDMTPERREEVLRQLSAIPRTTDMAKWLQDCFKKLNGQ
jgi:hypothetical protein